MKNFPDEPNNPSRDRGSDNEAPVLIPIDGVLDLHTFSPKEIPDLLDDYIHACLAHGIRDLRIIHGKGKGILRSRVRSLLRKHPLVETVSEASLEVGGWGATLVRLRAEISSLTPFSES